MKPATPNASLPPDKDKDRFMKTAVIAFCLLCASAAFGQVGNVLTSNPQPTVIADHPLHASEHAMADESNLRGSSAYTYARGEQPVWQFGTLKPETPLGDVARAYRKDHAAERKAVIVLEK
jgi:hypothetical protein